jgi:hypothetical protein
MRKTKKALRSELAAFQRATGRKRQKGVEPNDRAVDHKIQEIARRMDPVELDRLLREEDDEAE